MSDCAIPSALLFAILAQDAEPPPQPLDHLVVIGAVAALTAALVVILIIRRLGKTRQLRLEPLAIEKIDVSTLDDSEPPTAGPRLEVYHIPVRLALIVLAPLGREGKLPESPQLPRLVDQLVPGLMRVLEIHRPKFRRWPAQLSWEGFIQAFFGHANLPGDRGKGTRWCSIAGRFEAAGEHYLAGMICCAEDQNSLGQISVEHAGKWLDVVRVRDDASPRFGPQPSRPRTSS